MAWAYVAFMPLSLDVVNYMGHHVSDGQPTVIQFHVHGPKGQCKLNILRISGGEIDVVKEQIGSECSTGEV